MKQPIILAGLLAIATQAMAQEKPVLTVYTYDSFVSDWGPGPAIEKAFEESCGCDLQFVGLGDGAALLARLRLEGRHGKADVVVGLDTGLIATAAETGLFAPHGITAEYDLPVAWDDPLFIPYDWGYFAFVYDRKTVTDPPKSLSELAASDLKVVIEDPRSSTPGLGLLLWADMAFEEKAGTFWQEMADNVLTVTKGWSEAYGLFLQGEADMVLSYTTSPAYHRIAEQDDSKAAALFSDGHYMQIEVAARLASSDQPELAGRFLRFLLSDKVQSLLPTTNWMYPAIMPAAGLPEGFEETARPRKALLLPPAQVPARRDAALVIWRDALSR